MAIDTENKRRSALGKQYKAAILPVPDTSVDNVDRPHVLGYFSRNFAAIQNDLFWENGVLLKRAERGDELTTAALPPGNYVLLLKAIDTSGNYSEDPAVYDINVSNTFDIVSQNNQHPRWTGDKVNFIVHNVSGTLVPDDQSMATGDNFDVFDNFVVNPYSSCTYETEEIDLGFNATDVRIFADITGSLGPDEDGVAKFDLSIDTRLSAGSYDGFENWTIGSRDLRYLKQRIQLNTSVGLAFLSQFTPTADIQEVTQTGTESVSISGSSIVFNNQFFLTPKITITPDGGSAVYPVKSNVTSTGFDVTLYDSSGTSVSGTIDYIAVGA